MLVNIKLPRNVKKKTENNFSHVTSLKQKKKDGDPKAKQTISVL